MRLQANRFLMSVMVRSVSVAGYGFELLHWDMGQCEYFRDAPDTETRNREL